MVATVTKIFLDKVFTKEENKFRILPLENKRFFCVVVFFYVCVS